MLLVGPESIAHIIEHMILECTLCKEVHTIAKTMVVFQSRTILVETALPIFHTEKSVFLHLTVKALQGEVNVQSVIVCQIELISNPTIQFAQRTSTHVNVSLLSPLPHSLTLIVAKRIFHKVIKRLILHRILHRVVSHLRFCLLRPNRHLRHICHYRLHLIGHLYRIVQLRHCRCHPAYSHYCYDCLLHILYLLFITRRKTLTLAEDQRHASMTTHVLLL